MALIYDLPSMIGKAQIGKDSQRLVVGETVMIKLNCWLMTSSESKTPNLTSCKGISFVMYTRFS